LVEYDLTDLGSSIALVQKVQPSEIYNLAAQSFVGVSFLKTKVTVHGMDMEINQFCSLTTG
jgi:GDPmannose 4,6-dehydratase